MIHQNQIETSIHGKYYNKSPKICQFNTTSCWDHFTLIVNYLLPLLNFFLRANYIALKYLTVFKFKYFRNVYSQLVKPSCMVNFYRRTRTVLTGSSFIYKVSSAIMLKYFPYKISLGFFKQCSFSYIYWSSIWQYNTP